jgi:CRP-like cAMP-binding protein
VFRKQLLLNQQIRSMTSVKSKYEQKGFRGDEHLFQSFRAFKKDWKVIAQLQQMALTGQNNEQLQFLRTLSRDLETMFAIPEEDVITMGEAGNEMFYITQGDCLVNFQDLRGRVLRAQRLLVEGDHFGEICLAYRCKRTATVVSRNYNTMARLTYHRFRNLINEFPTYDKYLKQKIFNYDDPTKAFLERVLKELRPLTKGVTRNAFYDLLFSMQEKEFLQNNLLYRGDEHVESLMIVRRGVVAVVTDVEGTRFVLDYLYPGAVLNAVCFILRDKLAVDFVAHSDCRVFVIDRSTLQKQRDKHVSLDRRFLVSHNELLLKQVSPVLDYKHKVPRIRIPRALSYKYYH